LFVVAVFCTLLLLLMPLFVFVRCHSLLLWLYVCPYWSVVAVRYLLLRVAFVVAIYCLYVVVVSRWLYVIVVVVTVDDC
jgi:hypothetical protein